MEDCSRSWRRKLEKPVLYDIRWNDHVVKPNMQSLCTSVFTATPVCLPAYLTDELCQEADVEARQRLRSLIVSHTRLSGVCRRWPSFFGCHCSRLVQSACRSCQYSAPSVAVFRSRLKTHLFSARAVTLSCFGHYSRSSLLTFLLNDLKVVTRIMWIWYLKISSR